MAWHNWAGTAQCTPAREVMPAGVPDVVAAIDVARRDGLRVKAFGAGHSFTGAALTDGVHLRMDRLSGIVGQGPVQPDGSCAVRVRAGTRLHELNRLLDERGLALPNLGDIDRQTISGALATGTHGTGARFTGLTGGVLGVQVVTAAGEVREVGPGDGAAYQALRLGLGAFGVVTEVTLRAVPAFLLRARERPDRLGAVLESIDEQVDGTDHVEFFWFPHTDRVLTKHHDRLPPSAPAQPLPRWRAWLDDDLLANRVFEGTNRLAAWRPSLTSTINSVAAQTLSARAYVDVSHRVLITPRRVRFAEAEWAFPRAALASVLGELRAWIERSGEQVSFPVEVRFAAADDVLLSTAYERESCYVAVHQFHRVDHRRYFAAMEQIALAHEGRPHWGKLHERDAAWAAEAYPRFADVLAVRDQLDPERLFANAYLDRVLGP
ncbi:MAG TPA: D-arabinono-1,4-lactone oxidase [Dermatophilaceae bacterium]|nr:D-arabinono-1,4-lactone oxidase [Dermatophilaceae bacterium]